MYLGKNMKGEAIRVPMLFFHGKGLTWTLRGRDARIIGPALFGNGAMIY